MAKPMTQENKELLLKDLCARLPYRTVIQVSDWTPLDIELKVGHISRLMNEDLKLKPYLRPMSSMTEEEKKKLGRISCEGNIEHKYGIFYRSQDYLNSIHVDYRGLIEKGLALEATEDRYKF